MHSRLHRPAAASSFSLLGCMVGTLFAWLLPWREWAEPHDNNRTYNNQHSIMGTSDIHLITFVSTTRAAANSGKGVSVVKHCPKKPTPMCVATTTTIYNDYVRFTSDTTTWFLFQLIQLNFAIYILRFFARSSSAVSRFL